MQPSGIVNLIVASAQKGPYALRVRSVAEKAFSRKFTVKCFIVSSNPVYNIQKEENSNGKTRKYGAKGIFALTRRLDQ